MQQLFESITDYFILFSLNGIFRSGYTVLRNQSAFSSAAADLKQVVVWLESDRPDLPRHPLMATPSRNVPPAPNIAHTLHNRHVRQITTPSD